MHETKNSFHLTHLITKFCYNKPLPQKQPLSFRELPYNSNLFKPHKIALIYIKSKLFISSSVNPYFCNILLFSKSAALS